MTAKTEPKVTIIIETTTQSLAKDAGSAAFALAIFAPGLLADSAAMQWTGAVLFFVTLFAAAAKRNLPNIHRAANIQEARAALNEIEKEQRR